MFTKVRRINTHKKFPISILQYNILYLSRNLNNTFLFLMCLQALMKKTREVNLLFLEGLNRGYIQWTQTVKK